MINVHVITPIIEDSFPPLEDVMPMEDAGIRLRTTMLDDGPRNIESPDDAARAVPDTVRKCVEAEKAGADAIVIDCMCDPGLQEARCEVSIPVIGPMEASLHAAAMLGEKISIVTVLDSVAPMMTQIAGRYGFAARTLPVRVIDLRVREIEEDISRTTERLSSAALDAVSVDGAEVIILGCTGFIGCAEAIAKNLHSAGYARPVIDPMPIAIMQAASFARAGLVPAPRDFNAH